MLHTNASLDSAREKFWNKYILNLYSASFLSHIIKKLLNERWKYKWFLTALHNRLSSEGYKLILLFHLAIYRPSICLYAINKLKFIEGWASMICPLISLVIFGILAPALILPSLYSSASVWLWQTYCLTSRNMQKKNSVSVFFLEISFTS